MPGDIDQHSWLDGVHSVFGTVTSGCEHITTISQVETGSGDRPVSPVMLVSATASE
jgi:cyclophilin family peptidyl-prolyl cis-trans isomerase